MYINLFITAHTHTHVLNEWDSLIRNHRFQSVVQSKTLRNVHKLIYYSTHTHVLNEWDSLIGNHRFQSVVQSKTLRNVHKLIYYSTKKTNLLICM